VEDGSVLGAPAIQKFSCVTREPTHVSFNPFTLHETRFNSK